ncbi:selenoprotein K isoform X1 [Phascolarctos cinereus]
MHVFPLAPCLLFASCRHGGACAALGRAPTRSTNELPPDRSCVALRPVTSAAPGQRRRIAGAATEAGRRPPEAGAEAATVLGGRRAAGGGPERRHGLHLERRKKKGKRERPQPTSFRQPAPVIVESIIHNRSLLGSR